MVEEIWDQKKPMNEASVTNYVQGKPGVYGLFEEATSPTYYLRYVGQSDDLRNRLLQHLAESEPNPCIKRLVRGGPCTFGFVYVDTQTQRDAIEKAYIERWNPDCNRKIP